MLGFAPLGVLPLGGLLSAAANTSISAPLLTNNSTLYTPSVAPGTVTLTVPILTNNSTLYTPSVAPGTVTLTVPVLTNNSTLYTPSVAPGTVTLTVPVLTNNSTLYTPACIFTKEPPSYFVKHQESNIVLKHIETIYYVSSGIIVI